jgi:N-formylmaleamate deformylase
MAEWCTAICETNGIRMHYTRTGVGTSPLILLHGLTGNGQCWTAITQTLEGEYDLIMPDFRGHGKSSVPEYGYRYDDHANDVVGLINSLGISPPVLIGHSMGGLVAAVVASRYPALIRGLILADPTFIGIKQQREIRDSDVADRHRRVLNGSLEELLGDMQTRHPQRSLSTLAIIARARFETSMSAFDVLTPPYPDYVQLVASIDVPGLLVFGDSGLVSAELASKLQLINSKFQVAQIEGAGHGIYYDQPDRFSAIVRSFVRSMDKEFKG